MDKKRIITTVGPTSLNESVIRKMDKAGVDIFRINLSHTHIDDFESVVKKLLSWTDKTICPDTEGAQLRTGTLQQGTMVVGDYDLVELVGCDYDVTGGHIPLNVVQPQNILESGDLLKIDFHSVVIQVIEICKGRVYGRVIRGGEIGTNKGVSVDRDIILPPFTEKDLAALKISNRMGLKTVAFSFAAHGNDVKKLRQFFDYDIEVISKIESKEGLRHLESIGQASDGLLIDRGDLSRDVPLEKIIFAQNYIIEHAKKNHVNVYVATNFMENMIQQSQPTRAEIHDIVGTLKSGADGLVLAAETAIGKHPVECVRIMSRTIQEVFSQKREDNVDYLLELPADRVIAPHGGRLTHQHCFDLSYEDVAAMPAIKVNDDILSDIVQICEGTYSPLTGFMNLDFLHAVLDHYALPDKTVWTLPILFQVPESFLKQIPQKGKVAVHREADGICYAIFDIDKCEKMKEMNDIALRWFGTNDLNHPGVKRFFSCGEYILSGAVSLFKRPHLTDCQKYELTPRQTRQIFNDMGWHDVVGFHTRNVVHLGHEFIQRQALEKAHADAILISPVVGKKKVGDFKGLAIIRCYEEMMRKGYFKPFGSLLAAFSTYSRYSGPREAVFTAICRKNFGCNYFIVGRDHTGVGNYYKPDASQKMFDSVDIGMNILVFDPVHYCDECKKTVSSCSHGKKSQFSLSGTQLRENLKAGEDIDARFMREDISAILKQLYQEAPEQIMEI